MPERTGRIVGPDGEPFPPHRRPVGDEDRSLIRKVSRAIKQRPDLFVEGGKLLDERFSSKAIAERRARPPGGSAQGKRAEVSQESPRPVSARFAEVARDLLVQSHLAEDRFTKVRVVPWSECAQWMVVTWLAHDPDADAFRPLLTDFQYWPWGRREDGSDADVEWGEDGWPEDVAPRCLLLHPAYPALSWASLREWCVEGLRQFRALENSTPKREPESRPERTELDDSQEPRPSTETEAADMIVLRRGWGALRGRQKTAVMLILEKGPIKEAPIHEFLGLSSDRHFSTSIAPKLKPLGLTSTFAAARSADATPPDRPGYYFAEPFRSRLAAIAGVALPPDSA